MLVSLAGSRQHRTLRREKMVGTVVWKLVELHWAAAHPAHSVLSKTCRAEAEGSISHVIVKVSCSCKLEPVSKCHVWKVPPCVCQPRAGTS